MFSPHDPGTLLAAANKVFKSTDRGDSWVEISPDLTSGKDRNEIVTMGVVGRDITISKDDGIQSWPTIVALAESPKQAGVYYAGTDDGILQMSRDGGKSWQNITSHVPGFPEGGFVSRVVPSRYDAATVYVTVDNHRLNDYGPHIWVSKDYGATFTSLGGPAGETSRTLTEDTKNPDVLYMGTETGIFLSLDRGASWRRLKGDNFPTVRVDELTINPRENALLIATHGRAIWILDDLAPIQEYAAAAAAAGDAKLFTPTPALQWKGMDNRNDEFWGHAATYIGENPPTEAVIAYHLKKSVPNLKLRVTNGGRTVRTVDIPASRNAAGIQMVCWDQRVEPLVADSAAAAGLAAFGGRGGGGGRGGRGAPPVPGIPVPVPSAGYMPNDPCSDGPGGGGGGRGGFGGGGTAGPLVTPGTYTVQLVSGNSVLDAKSLRVVGDPAVRLAGAERTRVDGIANELHDMQQRATNAQAALNALNRQINDATPKVRDGANVPANVKSQFEAFTKDFQAAGKKFGVGQPAAAGGGRGGRGGGAVDPENVLGRITQAKASVTAFLETPSAATMRQYNDAKAMLPGAIAAANAIIARANAMSQTLKAQNITLTVPAPVK
jgi:hypothetical protein